MKALLLAGGESRRMGRPKALLSYHGRTLITLLTEQLLQVADEVFIITRPELVWPIESAIEQELGELRELGELTSAILQSNPRRLVHVIEDLDPYKGLGPLAGLYSGIYSDIYKNASSNVDTWYTILACDMPYFSIPLLRRMEAIAHQYALDLDAVVIEKQPFHGIYHARVLEAAEACLQSQHLRFQDLLQNIRVEELLINPEEQQALFNMNTPEEYAQFLQEKDIRN